MTQLERAEFELLKSQLEVALLKIKELERRVDAIPTGAKSIPVPDLIPQWTQPEHWSPHRVWCNAAETKLMGISPNDLRIDDRDYCELVPKPCVFVTGLSEANP